MADIDKQRIRHRIRHAICGPRGPAPSTNWQHSFDNILFECCLPGIAGSSLRWTYRWRWDSGKAPPLPLSPILKTTDESMKEEIANGPCAPRFVIFFFLVFFPFHFRCCCSPRSFGLFYEPTRYQYSDYIV